MKYLRYDEKLSKCFSSVIMDTLDRVGARVQCMNPAIKPLVPAMRLWGEAVTAYFKATQDIPQHPFKLEMEVIDGLKRGQVLVNQCDARELSASWGGLLTTAARARGAAGVVTDGGVRDYQEIVELGFPAFCKGLSPYDSLGRMDVVDIQVPITCGGIGVAPGDLIFADVDGVVVVPQALVDEVVNKAWEKVQGEDVVRAELRAGASVSATFAKYGIL